MGSYLDSADCYKDLGVLFEKFHQHALEAAMKANRVLACIRRGFINLNESMLLQSYKSMVRPILKYSNKIWGPYYILYSRYTVWGLISVKHQFLCLAVISAITTSEKQSYTKLHDCVKIATCMQWHMELNFVLQTLWSEDTTSTRILGISLGIRSHKHGTVARADQSLRCTERPYRIKICEPATACIIHTN